MMGCTASRQTTYNCIIFLVVFLFIYLFVFIFYLNVLTEVLMITMCYLSKLAYQVVQLWIFTEEWLVFSLLLVYKVFNVHIKAGGRDAFRSLCGLLTLLKQQRQKGEQRMSVETESTVCISVINYIIQQVTSAAFLMSYQKTEHLSF